MHRPDVLTVVGPVTETGRVCKMSAKEMESATKTLMERNPQVHVQSKGDSTTTRKGWGLPTLQPCILLQASTYAQ